MACASLGKSTRASGRDQGLCGQFPKAVEKGLRGVRKRSSRIDQSNNLTCDLGVAQRACYHALHARLSQDVGGQYRNAQTGADKPQGGVDVRDLVFDANRSWPTSSPCCRATVSCRKG